MSDRSLAAFGEELWRPSPARIASANVTRFREWLNATRRLGLAGYQDMWRWSVGDTDEFWRSIWEYFAVGPGTAPTVALADDVMPGAVWFPGTTVNFADQLLCRAAVHGGALEHHDEEGLVRTVSSAELVADVERFAAALAALGVVAGDCVAGYLTTRPETVVAMLATTLLGAAWTCCSPDLGPKTVLARLEQARPKVLVAVEGYRYGGRWFDRTGDLEAIRAALPTLRRTVIVDGSDATGDGASTTWETTLLFGASAAAVVAPDLPFDHPLWIVFTSGTTGTPKGLVHGHGGALLELLKMTSFHFDLKPASSILFFTTSSWIVFPVLVSSLMTGATVILYDGNPAYPGTDRLWRIVAERGVTHFGTSPTFVRALHRERFHPAEHVDLRSLECVVCTGSPLGPESYTWIYEHVAPDLWVTSVSGGTDVVSGLVGGVPVLPVRNGEIQCRCLGIPVAAFDGAGREVVGIDGELVVTAPIPTMPLRIVGDPTGERYRATYFERFPGVWWHGDTVRFTDDGSCVISGRADATLNRNGIRLGTGEIYRIVESLPGVRDSIVVHVSDAESDGSMVLAVVLEHGRRLDDDLRREIAGALHRDGSPRHVPDEIHQVRAVPYTLTGKKMEVPVRRILAGTPAEDAVDLTVVADPSAFDEFVLLAERRSVNS